jgi:hypothetical protein
MAKSKSFEACHYVTSEDNLWGAGEGRICLSGNISSLGTLSQNCHGLDNKIVN